jgi:hypothetical protein
MILSQVAGFCPLGRLAGLFAPSFTRANATTFTPTLPYSTLIRVHYDLTTFANPTSPTSFSTKMSADYEVLNKKEKTVIFVTNNAAVAK